MSQRSKIAVLLMFLLGTVAQENLQNPRVGDASLTGEQIAVYRAVLKSYQKGSQRVLHLANVTEPLDQTEAACLIGLDLKATKGSASVVHRLSPSFLADTTIVLVPSNRQQAQSRRMTLRPS